MDLINQDNVNTKKIKDNAEDIRKDIRSLMTKLKGLGGDSADLLSEEFSHLTDNLKNLSEQGKQMGKDSLENLYECTRRNPGKNLFYAFVSGLALALLIRK